MPVDHHPIARADIGEGGEIYPMNRLSGGRLGPLRPRSGPAAQDRGAVLGVHSKRCRFRALRDQDGVLGASGR